MATRIKAIKCPHCGSSNHRQIDEKRFVCNNCGTEFFLDDDDINININHYNHNSDAPLLSMDSDNAKKLKAALLIFFPVLILFFFISSLFHTSPISDKAGKDSIRVREEYLLVHTFAKEDTYIVFCISDRNYYADYNNKSKKQPTNGIYYMFRNVRTGEIVKEGLLISDEQKGDRAFYTFGDNVKLRRFANTRRWYLIIANRLVYEVNPERMTLVDAAPQLMSAQKALSSGFAAIGFINKNEAEGFAIQNNLGKIYYYCPATNHLYTKVAFDYATALPANEMSGQCRDSTYYLLQNASSEESENITRIWRVTYKHFNGDPEDRIDRIDDWYLDRLSRYRISEIKPVSSWFISFHPTIIYQDKQHILLQYEATMAPNSPVTLQLRGTDGRVKWTRTLNRELNRTSAEKSSVGYIITTWPYSFIEISNNGKQLTEYTLPEEYQIKAQ